MFYGIALGVLAFALYGRQQAHAPATMRLATALGGLWLLLVSAVARPNVSVTSDGRVFLRQVLPADVARVGLMKALERG